VKEGFVPLIRQVPGFVAFYLVDAGSTIVVSTSIFETQAGAEESNRRAADNVRQKMPRLLPNPPQISAGEVVANQAM
jgi:hypothetical protein